jgi:8-oxo-dGTP pyrophosphatase MutT (NUDIX family)
MSGPGASRPGEWLVHGERTVYDSSWVSVVLADVETPDGARIPEHHVVRAPLQVGGCLAWNRADDTVLLLWRHRFITDTWGWEVPAGRADAGEELDRTAARECLEETGWRPHEPLTRLARWHPSNGLLDQAFSAYLAEGAEFVGAPSDPSEAAEIAWVPVSRVAGWVDAGEVLDGFSLVTLLAFLRRRSNSAPPGSAPPG